jgi:hypothetical protein
MKEGKLADLTCPLTEWELVTLFRRLIDDRVSPTKKDYITVAELQRNF